MGDVEGGVLSCGVWSPADNVGDGELRCGDDDTNGSATGARMVRRGTVPLASLGRLLTGLHRRHCELLRHVASGNATAQDCASTVALVVKLDLEGHEPQALRGARSFLSNPATRPLAVVSEVVKQRVSVEALLDFMRVAGYTVAVSLELRTILFNDETGGDDAAASELHRSANLNQPRQWQPPQRGNSTTDDLEASFRAEVLRQLPDISTVLFLTDRARPALRRIFPVLEKLPVRPPGGHVHRRLGITVV